MTDAINEQVSAFLDGELPSAESELLLKRFERDPELRAAVGRYSLIGEALRNTTESQRERVLSRDFAQRVSQAIDRESMPGKVWRPVAAWLKPVAGGAIAAGVAAVALVSLRTSPVDQQSTLAAAGGTTAPAMIAETIVPVREPMPSDTVPVSSALANPQMRTVDGGRLANFVMAHNVVTGLMVEEAALEQIEPVDSEPANISPVSTRKPATR